VAQVLQAILKAHTRIIYGDGADIFYEDICPDIAIASYKGPRVQFDDLSCEDELGRGGFATVRKGKFKGSPVAVKVIRVEENATRHEVDTIFSQFRREIVAQSTFSHPNIVAVKAVSMEPLAVALELCSFGELYKYFRNPSSKYSWAFALKVLTFYCYYENS